MLLLDKSKSALLFSEPYRHICVAWNKLVGGINYFTLPICFLIIANNTTNKIEFTIQKGNSKIILFSVIKKVVYQTNSSKI